MTAIDVAPSMRRAAQQVYLWSPGTDNSVPRAFCAGGTNEAGVGIVTVTLSRGGSIVDTQTTTPVGGQWSVKMTLDTTDATARWDLNAYFMTAGPAGDGGLATNLKFDPNTVSQTACAIEVDFETADFFAPKKWVGPFQVTYPDPTIHCDTTYETAVAEYIVPPNSHYRFKPEFCINPPKNRTLYLPYVGPGLYVMRFYFIDFNSTVTIFTRTKFAT
jgi:hypothetical protein